MNRFNFRDLLKEPLFQFMVFGLFIYLLYGFFGQNRKGDSADSQVINVGSGEIGWLESNWQKRWNRPPTDEELNGLVTQYVREVVLYREALKMGLDKNDVIIRRRLAQKLEFLSSDLIKPPVPEDIELETFFGERIDNYSQPPTITITQVFFDPDKRDDNTLDDARYALDKLRVQDEPVGGVKSYGDRLMFQDYYPERTEVEIAKLFGTEFARSVFALKSSGWNGPILSGYGTHLVYVHSINPMELPQFNEVKNLVLKDWESEKQQELNDKFIEELISRYQIVLEEQNNGS
jgi:hypothetical protein